MLSRFIKILIAVIGCFVSAVQLASSMRLPLVVLLAVFAVLVAAGFGLRKLWSRKVAESKRPGA
jgi:hypothetical protein